MLSARDLRVRRGGRNIVDVHALDLAPGQVSAIVGPNGAGKSTLLRVLALLTPPDAGTVLLAGTPVTHGAARRAARREVTLVEQHPFLFRGTVRDNLAWPQRARRVRADVDGMAARLGLGDLLSRDARTLSGGEIQRVALARALLCRPRVLLLDEPTSAGDRTLRDTMEATLREARTADMAIAIASHQLADAYRWSDRVLGLVAGKLDAVTPENLFRASLPAGTGVKPAHCGTLIIHVETDHEGPSVIAIPPEDILLSTAPLQSSARNTFPGRIVEIREDHGDRLSVSIDAGTTLVARVTRGAVQDLGLTVGGQIVMTVKATAVRVF